MLNESGVLVAFPKREQESTRGRGDQAVLHVAMEVSRRNCEGTKGGGGSG